jgi:hypothetical protein
MVYKMSTFKTNFHKHDIRNDKTVKRDVWSPKFAIFSIPSSLEIRGGGSTPLLPCRHATSLLRCDDAAA